MRRLLAATLGVVLGGLALTGPAAQPAAAAEKYTIALIPGLTTDAFYITMRKHGPCRLDLSFVLSGDIVLLRKFGTTRSRRLLALGDGSHFLLRWLSPIIVLAEAIT